MTRDKAKMLLPIIQAFSEGKAIQAQHTFRDGWEDIGTHANFDADAEWRIKPEPREWWLVQWPIKAPKNVQRFETQAAAKKCASVCANPEIIHVREVLP